MSYSSFAQAEKDAEEHYLKYLADDRPPRLPQEHPASVGSSFDAYVKADLHAALFGAGSDPKYEFEALFETQVEPQNRDFARPAGLHCFEAYKHAGMYDELLNILKTAVEPPRFEFDVRCDLLGVPFLAKPDCAAKLPNDIDFTHDFKVNGYCSKSATSPNKGYMLCVDGYICPKGKQSRSNNQPHKAFKPVEYGGLTIDQGYLEDSSESWADQLSLYGWSLGNPIGSPNSILSIHQIVAKPVAKGQPILRVASFRARVRKSYQEHLAKRFVAVWERIQSGHVFTNLTREENDARMKLLDEQAKAMSETTVSEHEDFFNQAVRPVYRG